MQSSTRDRLFSGYASVPNLTNKQRTYLGLPTGCLCLTWTKKGICIIFVWTGKHLLCFVKCKQRKPDWNLTFDVLIGCWGARRLKMCKIFWATTMPVWSAKQASVFARVSLSGCLSFWLPERETKNYQAEFPQSLGLACSLRQRRAH